MKIKLTEPQLIGTHWHEEDDVVDIEDRRARKLITAEKAQRVHESTELTPIPKSEKKLRSAQTQDEETGLIDDDDQDPGDDDDTDEQDDVTEDNDTPSDDQDKKDEIEKTETVDDSPAAEVQEQTSADTTNKKKTARKKSNKKSTKKKSTKRK